MYNIKSNNDSFEKYIKKLNLLTINSNSKNDSIDDDIEYDSDIPELIDEIELENDNKVDNFKWIVKSEYLKKYYNIKKPSTSPIIQKKKNYKKSYLKPVCIKELYSLCDNFNSKKILKKNKELHYEFIFSKYYNDREKVDGTKISNNITICDFVLKNYKNHDIYDCRYKNKCFLCDYINKKKILGIKNEVYLNKFLYTKEEILSKLKIMI